MLAQWPKLALARVQAQSSVLVRALMLALGPVRAQVQMPVRAQSSVPMRALVLALGPEPT